MSLRKSKVRSPMVPDNESEVEMSGGNIRAGNPKSRSVHQAWYCRIITGEGLGTEEEPYYHSMEVSAYFSYHAILEIPWKASLVGLAWVAQPLYRVEAGTLQVETSYITYPDGEFVGWDWSPQGCIVTPQTMQGAGNIQWESWTFDNGDYVVPAKAGIGVQLKLIGCKLGDGTPARCQVQVVFEPTR